MNCRCWSSPVAEGAEIPPAAGRRAALDWDALRPRLREWRRYWIRDPLLGGLDFALHYGCRALPTEWCSAIGGRLGVLNGRYRYHKERERAQRLYLARCGGPESARSGLGHAPVGDRPGRAARRHRVRGHRLRR